MNQVYDHRKPKGAAMPRRETAATAQPSIDALRTGAAAPTQEQMGRRVDLPEAMREKMGSAFGADLSAVKLYESDAVAEAGANAITQGASIAFAPGMLDFTSFGGQALLGHELSHVVSQARGEVTGGGFLNDASLEARADREGAMAAAGQQVSLPTQAMSGGSAASAAGPMQADKPWKRAKAQAPAEPAEPTYAPYKKLDISKAGKVNTKLRTYDLTADDSRRDTPLTRDDKKGMTERLMAKYTGSAYKEGSFGTLNNGRDVTISGLGLNRMLPMLERSMGEGYSQADIEAMYDNLMAPHRADLDANDAEAVAAAQASFDTGMQQLKGMHYNKLKRLEATYGTLPSQMHPMDLTRLAGADYNDHFHMAQDTEQLLMDGGKYFNMDDEKDKEFKRLHDYYFAVQRRNHTYAVSELDDYQKGKQMDTRFLERMLSRDEIDPEAEAAIHGPSMTSKQQESYMSGLHRRAQKGGWQQRLFGRYK